MRLIDFPFKSALNKPVKLVCCNSASVLGLLVITSCGPAGSIKG